MTEGTVAVNLYETVRDEPAAKLDIFSLPINTNSVSPENHGSSPDLPVRKTSKNMFFSNLVAVGGLSLTRPGIVGQPGNKQVALRLCQKLRSLWAIGENFPDDERERYWNQSLYQEDPLPSCESRASIELFDTEGEETTESTSEGGGYVEDSHTALEFETAVPESKQECCRGEETRL